MWLLAPYHPGGGQGNIKQIEDATCVHFADHFDGRGGAPVLYHAHPPMEEVHGLTATKRRHWASTRSDRHQWDMPTPILGVYFIVKSLKKEQ
jgi:hypothetical protein